MIKDKKDVERITRELRILKKVRHPNIATLYEVSVCLQMYAQIIETDNDLYLTMEYANGGELFESIVTHGRLAEQKACKYY